jgi:hypothetical protein
MDTVTALGLLIGNLLRLAQFSADLLRAHSLGQTLTKEDVARYRALDDQARADFQAVIDAMPDEPAG